MNFRDRPAWRTVAGGSQAYVAAITQDFAGEIRTGAGVASVRRNSGKVHVVDQAGREDVFGDLVIASHADQALAMLQDPTPAERSLLGAFSYTKNQVSLHRDPIMMPRKKSWWSSWNYLGHTGDHSEATVTYWMNRLQPLATPSDLFVTLNPPSRIALKGELSRHAYDHPVFDGAAVQAQQDLWSLQGACNTWFCGSYFGHGFHEDGLQAGLAVAEQLGGGRRPWSVRNESDRILLSTSQPQGLAA